MLMLLLMLLRLLVCSLSSSKRHTAVARYKWFVRYLPRCTNLSFLVPAIRHHAKSHGPS